MARILKGAALGKHVHPISVSFYHEAGNLGLIDEKVELLQGVLFDKMSKSPLHYAIFQRLLKMLNALNLEGYCVRSEGPITTSDSEPEPDLAICQGCEDDFFGSHPTTAELVIEVAIRSLEIDRKKADIYATAGVREYWIVIPKAKSIEVYSEPAPDQYHSVRTHDGSTEVTSLAFSNLTVRLPDLFLPPSLPYS